MNKVELIHIECGIYNGVAIYKIGDKLLPFELGTPHYNDYGEYRVDTDFKFIKSLNGGHERGYVPENVNPFIELSDEQLEWWLNKNRSFTELGYQENLQFAGGKSEENIVIVDTKNDHNLVKFTDWEKREHDPFEHLMFNVFNVFYHWYQSDDFKPIGGLMIYSFENREEDEEGN